MGQTDMSINYLHRGEVLPQPLPFRSSRVHKQKLPLYGFHITAVFVCYITLWDISIAEGFQEGYNSLFLCLGQSKVAQL
jgi:hypothetical protein